MVIVSEIDRRVMNQYGGMCVYNSFKLADIERTFQ